jgi:hypothetical protein
MKKDLQREIEEECTEEGDELWPSVRTRRNTGDKIGCVMGLLVLSLATYTCIIYNCFNGIEPITKKLLELYYKYRFP